MPTTITTAAFGFPRRARFITGITALACVAVSCNDDVVTTPEPSASVVAPISQGIKRAPEQPFVEIAEAVPSFGGFFVEEGTLVGLVSDPSDASAVAQALNALRADEPALASLSIETRPADYSFRELAAWRDLAFDHALVAFDGVFTLDLDERSNRVEIGIESEALREPVMEVLSEFGVPEDAVVFQRAAPDVPLAESLTDRLRPVRGGNEIYLWDLSLGFGGGCTFGFSAVLAGSEVFFTASHCSYAQWDLDGTDVSQPEAADGNNLISVQEFRDPDPFACAGTDCRYSDASAFQYAVPTDSFDLGYISRVEGPPGDSTTAGSLVIDSSNPRWRVTGKNCCLTMQVNKIGATTGWTAGNVTDSCSDRTIEGGIELCQALAGMFADDGDSGAPIFVIESASTVRLVGLLNSRDSVNDLTVFSPFTGIEDDFGTVDVGYDPLIVNIGGPDKVPPNYPCTWWANVSGGSGGYTYEWSGVLSGTDSEISGSLSSSGRLYLDVTDSEGWTSGDDVYITVDQWADPCGI